MDYLELKMLDMKIWIATLVVLSLVSATFAFCYYKKSVVWKSVDLIWILFAAVGACAAFQDYNKLNYNNKILNLESKITKNKNNIYSHIRREKAELKCFPLNSSTDNDCKYLSALRYQIEEVLVVDKNIEIKDYLESVEKRNIGQISIFSTDKKAPNSPIDRLGAFHKRIIGLAEIYNMSMQELKKWQAEPPKNIIENSLLRLLGYFGFIVAFALRIGKSVADIRQECCRTGSTLVAKASLD
ncbi:hypothetical protein I6F65_14105 [Pseudoalteromonas sp. SWXJZ94C]|uniref:hypothetical protein n=1 Tax=Pseudoalteromonas sp. SWXJZ94C TaxID=2792065 RepID=UPI0018CEDA0F|nr:hypothetical protein [Pseudoalteromonas sp. SWXJZ94C]MBH0058092.1 hypothetical protein [Pseudoalteromonas sp. SWXJZ94C]